VAHAVLDVLVEAVAAVIGVDLGAANPQARAYRAAWKRRIQGNDPSPGVLENVLRERHVPGAFGPHDAPEVVLMYRAWEAGMPPGEARKAFGRNFDQEGAP
jgi:hypothetical protein